MTSKMGMIRLFICLGVILHIGALFSSATSPGIQAVFNHTYSGSVSEGNDIIYPFTHNTSNVPYRKLRLSAGFEAVFNQTYSGSVSEGNDMIYAFIHNTSKETAIRFHFLSDDAVPDFPILVVVKQPRSVFSWTVPYVSPDGKKYGSVSKTLCPDSSNLNASVEETIIVVVSTSSAIEVNFTLTGMFVDDFNLQSDTDITFSSDPSSPQFYQYEFPEGVNMVLVRAKSPNDTCAYFSVQKAECPIFEDVSTVRYNAGIFQTMTLQAAITVTRDKYKSGRFYVVMVVHSNDDRCENDYKTFTPLEAQYTGLSERTKIVTLRVEHTLEKYWKPVVVTLVVLIAIAILSFVIIFAVPVLIRKMAKSCARAVDSQEESIQADANENNIEATGNTEVVFVSNLSTKKFEKMEKKYNTYVWDIVTVSVFYALPVVQLVVTYQVVTNVTGNQDSCYYNFLCAKPYSWFSAYNNVYSNVGYVVLGFVFLVLVGIKHYNRVHNNELGIHKHYSLLYALGFALIMEGVMSASYHVCPNRANFQFDTSYMYMIACLGILTMYQKRHTDITASANKSFALIILIIFTGFLGMVFIGSLVFYIIFFFVHMLTYIGLSAFMYCSGTTPDTDVFFFKRIIGLYKKAFAVCKSEFYVCKCVSKSEVSNHLARGRVVPLIVGFLVNFALGALGIATKPLDFATHLLFIMIVNMVLYMLFYLFMKGMCGENVLPSFLLLVLTIALWGTAGSFFMKTNSGWQDSAAESREKNADCSIMGFYDAHDIWHLISAFALFVSFVYLLLLDDDLDQTPQKDIPVF
ncbi:SID1 transmembrane family member 1-like [Strongylocentrotus purpuratus]|uniref:SID1 transmembrane family member 1-like n=1 Tax=Strongylocentrotus purpuratus TaxID=7668 RepID=A0A7M7NCF1_STRPU|nr:SID1 transmembrane family member 1-like [Strongylocentrotus purpuratus]